MISFKILTGDTLDEILSQIFESNPSADKTFASDIVRLFLENEEEDIEYAITSVHGCLLVRVYDGEYCFIYPTSICHESDPTSACEEIRAYAVKEEIPLVFINVPAAAIGSLVPMFRHVNIDTADEKNRFYTVRVMSELALLDEMPSYIGFRGIGLTPLTPEDDEDYTRLCTDEETGKFWGYDYSQDEPNPDKSYFRESAEEEFYRGAALCLGVRTKDEFVGEATLYYFDLKGGCECAVRILPEFRRRGYALEALRTLKTLARRLGLVYLCASVDSRNEASIAMTGQMFPEVGRDDTQVRFKVKL